MNLKGLKTKTKEKILRLRQRLTFLNQNIKDFSKLWILCLINKFKAFLVWRPKFWQRMHFLLQDFNDFAKSSKSWKLYIFLILLSFSFCNCKLQNYLTYYFDFNFYNFSGIKVGFELACKMIDSSIGFVAAIFSIAFIIIGFLISTIKSHQEDTYDMIYKNILLFPTLYLSLTIMGFLMVFSLLRDSLNSITFINIVLWETFLIIVTLFRIGILFIKVIEHIKPKNVYNYYFLEIKKIAKRVHHNFKAEKNRKRLEEMKVSLEERLLNASANGETESLNHILSVYEEISKLEI